MNSGMIAAVALAAGLDEKTAETMKIDADFMKKYFPDVATSLVAEGKATETARIAGIEAAFMPGHEAIIKAHKADPAKTPHDAAMAVIHANNALLGKQVENLKADESQVKNLKSETANDALPAKKADESKLEGDEKYKAEWATGKPRAEGFADEKSYLAQRRAEDRGAVKVLKTRATA